MDQFAVISDVHGNRWALEAVLEDIDRAGLVEAVNLGDVLYGPLDPRGTADLLIPRAFPTVRGNQDREIVDEDAPASGTLSFVRNQLDAPHLRWLRELQPNLVIEGMLLCHGTPWSDTTYLLWSLGEDGAVRRSAEEVGSELEPLGWDLVLCGHDHVPFSMQLAAGKTVVNPGSVGLQAYTDDEPFPHLMQTGSPHARYSVVERVDSGWRVSQRTVEYDWGLAVKAASKNRRPDWVAWLKTGQA